MQSPDCTRATFQHSSPYVLILWTRGGLGFMALVEAQRTLMTGTTSFKTGILSAIKKVTLAQSIIISPDKSRLCSIGSISMSHSCSYLFGCPLYEFDLWWLYTSSPTLWRLFKQRADLIALECPLEMCVPSGLSLFDEAFADDIPGFPSSRSTTTERSTSDFIFLQAPGLFSLFEGRSWIESQFRPR